MIRLKNIQKRFGDLDVIKGIDLDINNGEVISIIGPSGTGKSTLLRCINCLEIADQGEIQIEDYSVNISKITNKDKQWIRRNTAMVFQGFNLFNNKTVLQNITEGLIVVKKMKKSEAEDKALKILKDVDILEKKDNYPSSLSGGQQQRVAIGRALALEPKILLFDEPTSALDPELVSEVLVLMKELAKEKRTMLIVTHEINFARNVSDRVCFMDQGIILEEGPAKEIIDNPKNERTKQFLNAIRYRE
ncbi:amino acid ABC transporter ATP-binding protein [Tissierella sp. MB52-C2]|uniref:amino acid ABC transporter ATP-binding protein n=1 Tax=Tissierella sp. MB52-C2 TaxID=3070999 RepID=UPI00280B28AE|nr:amino acid ABC transporter ATP-binding protein [Tissierella sp. MB52-C2]WMM25203.1 amino acid ABC transporter ATP-binding protein [Tissierella sp. MB52-C2]